MIKLKKSLFRLSVIVNILIIPAFLFLFFHYDIPGKIKKKINRNYQPKSFNKVHSYKENINYNIQRSLYEIYSTKKADVIMLGDSITQLVDWKELLGENSVVNMGIAADTTEGVFNRLAYVYNLKPRLCFIMMGVNDIIFDVPVKNIFENYVKIVLALEDKGIIPVIQSTLYVYNNVYCNYAQANIKIGELNSLLRNFSKERGIYFLDLNLIFSKDNILKNEFTYDGIHLKSAGYAIWRTKILSIIKEYLPKN
jgi:lysophospholipase L1-like esterase